MYSKSTHTSLWQYECNPYVKNPMFYARIKHIELNVYFFCEKIAKESLFTQHVPLIFNLQTLLQNLWGSINFSRFEPS